MKSKTRGGGEVRHTRWLGIPFLPSLKRIIRWPLSSGQSNEASVVEEAEKNAVMGVEKSNEGLATEAPQSSHCLSQEESQLNASAILPHSLEETNVMSGPALPDPCAERAIMQSQDNGAGNEMAPFLHERHRRKRKSPCDEIAQEVLQLLDEAFHPKNMISGPGGNVQRKWKHDCEYMAGSNFDLSQEAKEPTTTEMMYDLLVEMEDAFCPSKRFKFSSR